MLQGGAPDTHRFTVDPSEIPLERTLIERGMGYPKGSSPDHVSRLIDEILPSVPDYLAIQCGYAILVPDQVKVFRDSVWCAGETFTTGSVIAKRLRKSQSMVLFAASAGPGLEHWARELMDGGDMLRGYVVDAIASIVVEETATWLEAKVEEAAGRQGWNITNRYSPGHCGWSVGEQHALFSFFPKGFCGIALTPTALMIPIKSVSGIFGVGVDVAREEHQCLLCDVTDCYRRQFIDAGESEASAAEPGS